jgi:hypothetical protein
MNQKAERGTVSGGDSPSETEKSAREKIFTAEIGFIDRKISA